MSEPDDTPTRLRDAERQEELSQQGLTRLQEIGSKWQARAETAEADVSRLREELNQALELLHSPDKWMKWCDHKVLERCELAGAEVSRLQQENAKWKAACVAQEARIKAIKEHLNWP
jgi:hypothetical protein